MRQRTLKNPIYCAGVGLHSGSRVSMAIYPAGANQGVRFRRLDLAGGPVEVQANWRNAIEAPLCTTLVSKSGVKFCTIEHLLSAFLGCGIDNALVELNGEEVPAMDGSAAPFVALIDAAGSVEQGSPRRTLQVLKPVVVREPHRSASLIPSEDLSIDFEIDFDSPVVARQEWSIRVDKRSYKREIARARTFGFLHEVDKLRAMGLARGGSLENAIVIDHDRIVNQDGLRYDNEFVRHKVLDAIGDLYLVGGPLLGRFQGVRAGHSLTLRLLQALFADASAWRWRDLASRDDHDQTDRRCASAPADQAAVASA